MKFLNTKLLIILSIIVISCILTINTKRVKSHRYKEDTNTNPNKKDTKNANANPTTANPTSTENTNTTTKQTTSTNVNGNVNPNETTANPNNNGNGNGNPEVANNTSNTDQSSTSTTTNSKTTNTSSSSTTSSSSSTSNNMESTANTNNTNENKQPSDANVQAAKKKSLEEKWTRLFTDPSRTSLSCNDELKFQVDENEKSEDGKIGGRKYNIPRKSKDIYAEKLIGFGDSSYLYDFLDKVFNEKLTKCFSGILSNVKSFSSKSTSTYKDPYSIGSMLNMPSENDDEILINKLLTIHPKFNHSAWKSSVNGVQLNSAITTNNWYTPPGKPDAAKAMINAFDFNGDGRLSPRELLIANVVSNNKINSSGQCKNCCHDEIKTLIDPIYANLDCDNNGKLTAEELWKGLHDLKSTFKVESNFLESCKDKKGANYRTKAVSDFIIKSAKAANTGYVTKDEFKSGILLGFVQRLSDNEGVTGKSLKELRWSENNTKDIACEINDK